MDKRRNIINFIINNSIFIAIVVLVIVTAAQYPLFIKNAPHALVMRTAAYVIMALGMGCIMLIGGIDLSTGRIMGLTALVSYSLLENCDAPTRIFPNIQPLSIFWAFLIVILVGMLIGAFNGIFVGKFKLHPFLVTLCVQLMLRGTMLIYLGLGVNKGQSISNLRDDYKYLITDTVKIGSLSIPNYAMIAIAAVILVWVIWEFTPLGKRMRLYGENREAAEAANINGFAITVIVFAMAGCLYALNGFIETARIGGPGVSVGNNAETEAIIACVLGGVSLRGGIGKIGGIVVGVVLLQLVSVCLQWLSVSVNAVYIIKGALMLWAVAIDARKNYTGSGPAIWKWK